MAFIITKIVSFLFSPVSWILIGIIITSILAIKNHKATKIWLLITAGITIVFTNPFISNSAIHLWEKPHLNKTLPKDTVYDYAVVLTGMLTWDQKNEQYNFGHSVDRLLETVELWHQKKVKKIIITGGDASIVYDMPPESLLLKQFLVNTGIPDNAIIAEKKSRNTYEHAIYIREQIDRYQIKEAKMLLVTSAYHMSRAEACFEKQNIAVETYPVDFYAPHILTDYESLIIPQNDALLQWKLILHEWIGFLYYKISGYIE